VINRKSVNVVLLVISCCLVACQMALGDDPPKEQQAAPKKQGVRARRGMRWELGFKTETVADYLKQLDAIGAIVSVADENKKVHTISDLKARPATLELLDMKKNNRIFLIDETKESRESISEELKLKFIPSAVIAFIPVAVEEELLSKEMELAKTKGIESESDIEKTRFDIRFKDGKYVITVAKLEPVRPTKDP